MPASVTNKMPINGIIPGKKRRAILREQQQGTRLKLLYLCPGLSLSPWSEAKTGNTHPVTWKR
jgi:hypothetical protein